MLDIGEAIEDWVKDCRAKKEEARKANEQQTALMQQMMMQQMQQMQMMQQQQGAAGVGGGGVGADAGMAQYAYNSNPSGKVEFNPETGMPMVPAGQVLPPPVQPVAGPAPTPTYQEFD